MNPEPTAKIECADCGKSIMAPVGSIDARLFMLDHYRVSIDPNPVPLPRWRWESVR